MSNIWKCPKHDNMRPEHGTNVLFAFWYDGWNYDVGYYISHSDEIVIHDARNEKDCTHLEFSEIDCWMPVAEPDCEWI